jgi:hypothetical protein
MVLFAGYIIKNCATLLDANNIAKTGESVNPTNPPTNQPISQPTN